MTTYLSTFNLPYQFPLNISVRFKKCNFFTGMGNFASGEVLFNNAVVHTSCCPSRNDYERIYKKVSDLMAFLSDLSLDRLTKEEYDYLCNDDDYLLLSKLFSITKWERNRLNTRLMKRNTMTISHDTMMEVYKDTSNGLLTGEPFQTFRLEQIDYDRKYNKIYVKYQLLNKESFSKEMTPSTYFIKCFWFGIKYNLFYDIIQDQCFGRLSVGSIGEYVGGYPIDISLLPKLGYARII